MMPSIMNVLIESFRLLRHKPELFVPKLVSTAIGALWFIGFVSGTGGRMVYAATGPLTVLLGAFVSVMMASMVRNPDSDNVLREGWNEATGRIGQIVISSLVLLMVALVIFMPVTIGLVLRLLYGNQMAFLVGAGLTGLMFLVFAFLVYFFPISLLEKGSVREGFRDSVRTSRGNSFEVVFLTLLSFALLAFASFTGQQGRKYAGYIGFFVLRVVSGIFTTYLFVVSPEYYLSN